MATTLREELKRMDREHEVKNKKELEAEYVEFAWRTACDNFKNEKYISQHRDSLCIVFSQSDKGELSIVVMAQGENLKEFSYKSTIAGTMLDSLENVLSAIENEARKNEMETDRGSEYLEVKY